MTTKSKRPSPIGRRIRTLREGRSMSREQLAARAGVSLFTLRKIEMGVTRDMVDANLDRIASVFGGTRDDLRKGA